MIRINQLKIDINYTEKELRRKIIKALRISEEQLISYKLVKRSLDARKKPRVHYVCVIDVNIVNESIVLSKNKQLVQAKEMVYEYPTPICKPSPIIVGFGPAGLFAAYILAELGLKPVVFERGEDVDSRTMSVESFWETGDLNPNSNVQYGEGGAGTFSDGKLTTRSKDPRAKKVLDILVKHGAPEEILYMNKPHVGTDILKDVVKSMRAYILEKGGTVNFNAYVKSFDVIEGRIKGIVLENNEHYHSDHVILAVGHSARDTYEVLYDLGLDIEQKPFAMGVRIEHLQDTIDLNQYGILDHREFLGASDYKLTHKASNGRSVYSFCVCPGGMVVASSSEHGGLVVNGMSEHARDQKNINSAILVQIQVEDFESTHPLAGVYYQRKYEQKAFELGGNNYHAPAETLGSFLHGTEHRLNRIIPSYKPGVKWTQIKECLPDVVCKALKEGLVAFGKKIEGFDAADVVITAIESRSSAPIRMNRDYTTMESSNIKGLYPIGEGAGFAGGIVSSAIDGIKVAEIVATF
ncbi:MAG: hypothetical protein JEZ08_19190 [Clostridiales bacterium]|nr:hypothetical protein [Clostridiales bacterium]